MSRTNRKDTLVFTGPEYAQMVLEPEESFYENISLAHALRLLEREESLWGKDHGSAKLHWCFKEPYPSDQADARQEAAGGSWVQIVEQMPKSVNKDRTSPASSSEEPERETPSYAFVPNTKKPSLVMLYNVAAGFHFRFDFADTGCVAFDSKAPIEGVKHDICGEPAYFPRSTFVPLPVAKGVVRKFVREKSKYTRLKWVDPDDFDYHDPDAWRAFDARCR